MATTFVGGTTATADSGTGGVTINLPAGVQENDFLILSFIHDNATGNKPNAPSGWAELLTQVTSAGDGLLIVWTRKATSSEPSSVTVSGGGSGATDRALNLVAYRGVDQTSPIDQSASQTGGTSPSVTTTVDGARVVRVAGSIDTAADTLTVPAGTTSRAEAEGAAGVEAALGTADTEQATAGSTGTAAWTFGGSRRAAATIALTPGNTAPTAATPTYPTGGVKVDRAEDVTLTWTFNDPDAGDTQSAYEARWRTIGWPAWTTTAKTTSADGEHTITAGGLVAANYEWQVLTYDAAGLAAPWTSSAFFTAADRPPAPSITSVADGGTISTDPHQLEWAAPDQDAYQVRTVEDDAGSPDTDTVYYDTGIVTSTARTASVPFATNNRFEHIQVRVRTGGTGGLWSDWESHRVEVSYTPPATPTHTVQAAANGRDLEVDITNPAGGTTVVDNTLRRQQSTDGGTTWTDKAGTPDAYDTVTGIPPNDTHTDRTVANRVEHRYQVVAHGDNQTTATGTWS